MGSPPRTILMAGLLALLPAAPANAGEAVPQIVLPDSFERSGEAVSAPYPGRQWWRLFGDPQIDPLIERVHAGNLTIRQSAARLAAARAAARAGQAGQAPYAGIDATATHANGPLVNAAGGSGNLFTAGASLGWELDLLGRYRAERLAEREDAEAAGADLAGITLLMEAEAVRTWLAGRAASAAAANAAAMVELRRKQLGIAMARRAAGTVPPSAVDDAQRELDVSDTIARRFTDERDSAGRALALLLGDTTPVAFTEGQAPAPLPIPAGLPSALLLRRPDILAARYRLIAADARLASAKVDWLPVLGLTASGGGASSGLGQLLSSAAGSFGLGALFALPLFDGGRHKARVAAGAAGRDLAEARYREAVLGAFHGVDDALQQLDSARRELVIADEAVRIRAGLLATAEARSTAGTISGNDLAAARLAHAQSILDAAARRSGAQAAAIDLVVELGGGW